MKMKTNALEQDFDKVKAEIKAKLDEAAALINSANILATMLPKIEVEWSDEKEIPKLSDLRHDITRPLINAIDNSGWSTSSFSC